jgi:hypothetical protein
MFRKRLVLLPLLAAAATAQEEPLVDEEVLQAQREVYRQRVAAKGGSAPMAGPSLPDEQALFEKNVCAICEATAYQGAAVLEAHLAEKRKRRSGRTSDLDFVAALEALCTDRSGWHTRYRQELVRLESDGTYRLTMVGPGIAKASESAAAQAAAASRSQFPEFDSLIGPEARELRQGQEGGGGPPQSSSANLTDPIVNTLEKDCAGLLFSGEPDEDELLAIVDASRASKATSRQHEADKPPARALRKALCGRACR